MITIIFTVCSMAAQFKTCLDKQLPVDADVNEIHMCEKKAMPLLAKWAADNPNWWITRFRCKDMSKPEEHA